ncbi:hypothetical protein KKB18_00985, partial [bacterium]|nr:hypothetical protein [bacterium]
MKKPSVFITLILIAALSCLTILGACNKIFKPSPNEILSFYLDAFHKGRYEEAYGYVSSQDKAVKSMDDYIKEEKEDNPFVEKIRGKSNFKILNITKTGDKAKAEVEIILPDIDSLFGVVLKSVFGNNDQKEIDQTLAKKLENNNIPLKTEKMTYNLVKETDGWKVFLDWKTEKINKDKQEKIQRLLDEAKELKKSKKINEVLKKYNQVLELDSEIVEAKDGIKEAKNDLEEFEEKQAYIQNVVLYDLKSKYYESYLESKCPGVEFKIKNKGDKTLKEVEVTVYFKDGSGSVIAEEIYHPVLVTEYSYSGDNKPLKP